MCLQLLHGFFEHAVPHGFRIVFVAMLPFERSLKHLGCASEHAESRNHLLGLVGLTEGVRLVQGRFHLLFPRRPAASQQFIIVHADAPFLPRLVRWLQLEQFEGFLLFRLGEVARSDSVLALFPDHVQLLLVVAPNLVS